MHTFNYLDISCSSVGDDDASGTDPVEHGLLQGIGGVNILRGSDTPKEPCSEDTTTIGHHDSPGNHCSATCLWRCAIGDPGDDTRSACEGTRYEEE